MTNICPPQLVFYRLPCSANYAMTKRMRYRGIYDSMVSTICCRVLDFFGWLHDHYMPVVQYCVSLPDNSSSPSSVLRFVSEMIIQAELLVMRNQISPHQSFNGITTTESKRQVYSKGCTQKSSSYKARLPTQGRLLRRYLGRI